MEDRRSHAVAHLASARSQKAGTGIPDIFFWRKIREENGNHIFFAPADCRRAFSDWTRSGAACAPRRTKRRDSDRRTDRLQSVLHIRRSGTYGELSFGYTCRVGDTFEAD